jgi:sec-independent protein translocase protein TatA
MPSLGGWELVILLAVLVLVFGAKKLPDMARSIGQSARVLKGEMKGLKSESEPEGAPVPPAPPVAAAGALPAPAPVTPETVPAGQPDRVAGDR